MGKFVFKLNALLNLKTQMEESLKNELGKAVQKLEHEKNILKQIEVEMDDCITEFNLHSSTGIVIEKLREYTSYISLLKERIKLQKVNVNYTQLNVDKYRGQLVIAMQERKMLEKLRDKKYQEYLETQLKGEQRINDETVSFNYNNQKT